MSKQINFRLPSYLENKIIPWNNGDYTFVVGLNGSGKTTLLELMKEWADHNKYSWVSYDSMEGLNQSEYFIENASDEDIIYACKLMSDLSQDFQSDIFGWAKHKNGNEFGEGMNDFMQDADLLRDVLSKCGNGYMKFFAITMNIVQALDANYYFLDLPEASLHIDLAQRVLNYLMVKFPFTKFVITTHSPAIIDDKWDRENIIEMD